MERIAITPYTWFVWTITVFIGLLEFGLAPHGSLHGIISILHVSAIRWDYHRVEKDLLLFGTMRPLMTIKGISKLHDALLSLELAAVELKFLHDVVAANSSLVFELEHAGEEVLVEHPDLGGHGDSFGLEHFEVGFHVHALVAGGAHEHFVEHDTYGPDIALLGVLIVFIGCLLYTSPSPRDQRGSRMPSSA